MNLPLPHPSCRTQLLSSPPPPFPSLPPPHPLSNCMRMASLACSRLMRTYLMSSGYFFFRSSRTKSDSVPENSTPAGGRVSTLAYAWHVCFGCVIFVGVWGAHCRIRCTNTSLTTARQLAQGGWAATQAATAASSRCAIRLPGDPSAASAVAAATAATAPQPGAHLWGRHPPPPRAARAASPPQSSPAGWPAQTSPEGVKLGVRVRATGRVKVSGGAQGSQDGGWLLAPRSSVRLHASSSDFPCLFNCTAAARPNPTPK